MKTNRGILEITLIDGVPKEEKHKIKGNGDRSADI